MSATPSTMVPLGTVAADFRLPETDGKHVSRSDFSGKPLLLAFICNHCPFVKHIQTAFAKLGRDYQAKGVSIVGINSNDVASHPDDSPAKMVEEKKTAGYTFPYLYDESQAAAKAYRAVCTPDLFLFDHERRLRYRGQFDGSRPGGRVAVSGADLRAATEALLSGHAVAPEQIPSVGCSIKWKPGQQPDWA